MVIVKLLTCFFFLNSNTTTGRELSKTQTFLENAISLSLSFLIISWCNQRLSSSSSQRRANAIEILHTWSVIHINNSHSYVRNLLSWVALYRPLNCPETPVWVSKLLWMLWYIYFFFNSKLNDDSIHYSKRNTKSSFWLSYNSAP